MRYKVDYNAENKMFTLFDNEEQALFILTKEQLEQFIRLYDLCCYREKNE